VAIADLILTAQKQFNERRDFSTNGTGTTGCILHTQKRIST
jgi:hypothetical protein